MLAENAPLPRVEEGDWIVIHDVGGYTLGLWSRHSNRGLPLVLGYSAKPWRFRVLLEGESRKTWCDSGEGDRRPRVRARDPAIQTASATSVEAIDSIHKTLVRKWKAQGRADKGIATMLNAYVPKHLLTRLHASAKSYRLPPRER